MSSRFIICLCLLLSCGNTYSQDISGTWTGNYGQTFLTTTPEKLIVEIFINNDSLITGASHLYYKDLTYEHYKIKGIFNKRNSTVYFSEDSTIAIKLGPMYDNCLGNYSMKLDMTNTAMKLTGTWKDNSTSLFNCPSTGVWLEKLRDKKEMVTKPKKDSVVDQTDKNMTRNSDIQSLIEIPENEKDSIKIDIYDNGIVDNDYISVYFNDSLVISNKMISQSPITFYLSLDLTKINKIKLASESMGSIPPCTALMFVTTKKKKYQVNLSSDQKTNAVLEFFLKE
jgi:hypothetical protein